MKTLKKTISITTCLLLFLTITFVSCDKDEETIEEIPQSEVQNLITDIDQATVIFEEQVEKTNGEYVLKENDPLKLRIEPRLFDELLENFNIVKEMLKNKEIEEHMIGKDQFLNKKGRITTKDCGSTKVKFWWTSIDVYLSRDGVKAVLLGSCAIILPGPAKFLCPVIVYALDRWASCRCGVKLKYSYTGILKSASCQ